MSRLIARQMKRAIAAGNRPEAQHTARVLAKESALSLLARSIGFSHGKLDVIRLSMAVLAGADIPQQHWDYCSEAASLSKDRELHALFFKALGATEAGTDGAAQADHSH